MGPNSIQNSESNSKPNFWLEPRTLVAYAVSLLALAEIVDLTIVAVAIPHIMGSLNTNLSEVSLTMTSYIVAAAICIPLTGLVTRKFGMKRVLLVSSVIFGISSVLCGASTSLTQMVIFRLIQGIGGAFLPSIAQSYMSRSFTPKEQPKMMTLYSLCIVMGPILGPIFGGSLAENLNWRWCFYVNLPLCIAAFLLIWHYMKNEKEENVKIDYISFAFMAFGIACLEYFIDEGNTNNWFDSMEMVIILAIAIVLLIFFIWRGILGKSVVNFAIFKNFNFVMCCMSMLFFMTIAAASLAYFPTMLQQSFGYPVDTAGYITAPRGMVAFIAAPIVAALAQKFDARKVMMIGLILFSAAGYMLSSYAPAVSQFYIIVSMLIQGAGMMAFFIPIMQIVFIGVPENMHSDVSGMFNFFRNIASSIGTSLSSTIVTHQMQVTYHDMGSHISPYSTGFMWWSQRFPSGMEAGKTAIANFSVINQGALVSYLDSFYLFGSCMLLLLWLPFVLKRPMKGSPVHLD